MANNASSSQPNQGARFSTEPRTSFPPAKESLLEKAKDVKDTALEKAEQAKDTIADKAKDMASSVAHGAKDMASSVAHGASDAATAVGDKAQEGVSAVGSGMKSLAGTIRENAPHEGHVGSAATAVADSLESGGRYLQEEGLSGMANDLTGLIRRNPIPALLVGIGIGFMIAKATRS